MHLSIILTWHPFILIFIIVLFSICFLTKMHDSYRESPPLNLIIPLPIAFFKQTHESGLNASFRFHPFFINRGFIFYNSFILRTTTSKKFFRHPTTNSVIAFCMLIHRYPTKRIYQDWAEPTNLSLISLLVGHTKNQSSRALSWILLIKSSPLLTFG